MENNNYTPEVRAIMMALSANPVIVLSWGLSGFEHTEDSCSFNVNGYLYQGTVKIQYVRETDLFDVILSDRTIRDVYIGELINVIDKNVECDNEINYKAKVIKQYVEDREN